MPQVDYNAWRITSLSTLPGWALALAALGIAAAVWLSFRGIRSEPSRLRRSVLIGLRVLAGALLLALLLEPGIELRAETRVRARVALLLDTSRSMRFPASTEGTTRAEEMLRWLKSHLGELSALASRFQVDVYGFDKELAPQDPQKLAGFARSGRSPRPGPLDRPGRRADRGLLGGNRGTASRGSHRRF